LGVGKKHLLIPAEGVSRDVSEERVTVTEPRDKVLNSPEFDPEVGVPPADLQRAIEAYYGHRWLGLEATLVQRASLPLFTELPRMFIPGTGHPAYGVLGNRVIALAH
jgi:hypothetical protein